MNDLALLQDLFGNPEQITLLICTVIFVWCLLRQRNGGMISGLKSATIVTPSFLRYPKAQMSVLVSTYIFYARPERSAGGIWCLDCLSVRLPVRLSVRPIVHNSVPLTFKVQYLKFGWSYSKQTWTVSSSKGCSHFTDITCPWEWAGSKLGTWRFCKILTLGGIRVSQTHV